MRPRKLAAALPAELSRDDLSQLIASEDDGPVNETAPVPAAIAPGAPVCLECGGDGGCEHHEAARLIEPSGAVDRAVARLRRASVEQRAASRALRALVMSEIGRNRAEIEAKEPVGPAPEAACPRCTAGERGEAASERGEAASERGEAASERGRAAGERGRAAGERGEAAGERGKAAGERGKAAGERGDEEKTAPPPRKHRRRLAAPEEQQTFAFDALSTRGDPAANP